MTARKGPRSFYQHDNPVHQAVVLLTCILVCLVIAFTAVHLVSGGWATSEFIRMIQERFLARGGSGP